MNTAPTLNEAAQRQIELYRRMTPQQRLQITFRLYELVRTVTRQGVRHQHPDWDEQRVEQEVIRRCRLATGAAGNRSTIS